MQLIIIIIQYILNILKTLEIATIIQIVIFFYIPFINTEQRAYDTGPNPQDTDSVALMQRFCVISI